MKQILLIAGFVAFGANASSILTVPEDTWHALETPERAEIQKTYLVETVRSDAFGLIIDNQGVDRSTPGTHAGALLGGAVADATYIDRALGGGNYSAKTHLGVMILGGLIGSTLDRPAESQYQFRYAIKLHDGNVIYQDNYSAEPFRHPSGVCVLLPEVKIAPNQNLCTLTPDLLRATYLNRATPRASQAIMATPLPAIPIAEASASGRTLPSTVNCKLNNLPPVQTTPEKCNSINGRVISD